VPEAAIARSSGGFVPGHLLRHFEFPPVLQIHGDPRRAEAVAGNLRRDARRGCPPPDHLVDLGLRHRLPARELTVPEPI
jgi:hypothetical protein